MPHPYQNLDITGPALDFVHVASGMVSAVRVETGDDIAGAVAKAVGADRLCLVEIAIEGKRRCGGGCFRGNFPSGGASSAVVEALALCLTDAIRLAST
jgi:hypothetical protein